MRKIKSRFTVLILGLGLAVNVHAWNSVGHRIVAKIAYDQLTPQAKQLFEAYNHALDKVYSKQSLISAAPWLDQLRYRNELWLQLRHYIDTPYSIDNTPTTEADKINAILAINEAVATLENSTSTPYDKGFSLRILLHVVGDIHQPMHAVNLFSKAYPNGDEGGNLVKLATNSVGNNLHAYWDNGGGVLKSRYAHQHTMKLAQTLEKQWPCNADAEQLNPKHWADESYQIATELAYTVKEGERPSKVYQRAVQATIKQRLALAGCRLGNLLNKIAKN